MRGWRNRDKRQRWPCRICQEAMVMQMPSKTMMAMTKVRRDGGGRSESSMFLALFSSLHWSVLVPLSCM
uniref:Uncharacterized protein n=1 Tax=Arundo donax TaxID=35708 RepID=A0A0A9C627_ARUDO